MRPIQNAGVERFQPSEGYVHPLWDMTVRLNEQVVLHPASFIIIGYDDFCNQDHEPVWCPWTQRPEDLSEYVVYAIGGFMHLEGFARVFVTTICELEKL